MRIIKEKFIILFNKIKRSCFDYRVTVIGVAVATLYAAFYYALDDIIPYGKYPIMVFLDDMLRFLILFILAVMFTESVFSYEKKGRRIKFIRTFGFVLSAVIAAVFITVQNIAERPIIAACATRYCIVYIILLLLGIIYFSHRRSGAGFIEYILHVGVNFCVVTAIYIVLIIGVLLILAVLELLFFSGAVLNECILILVTGLYYVPGCIAALGNMDSNIDDEISRVLMTKVLSGMTFCAMAIVYAYLLKILIAWQMPSNEIFGIVSGLFCIGMPIWIIDYHYRDDTKYTLFLQRLPYGMIPMIPVQAYAMCVRIYNNGMTTGRYIGMLLVAFEIIILLIWRLWRDKMERVIIVMDVCVLIAVCFPGINMYSVSNRWQQSILVSVYDKVVSQQEIEQKEYDRMVGAYKYLRRQPGMEGVLEQYDIYDDDFGQLLAISDLDTDDKPGLSYRYIHCCQLVGELNVDGYSRLDMVNQDPMYQDSHYETEEGESNLDFSTFRFYNRSEGEDAIFEVDISDFADKCFAYEEEYPDASQEEASDAMRPYQEIVIDDDTVLYINHFEVRYTVGVKDKEEYIKYSSMNVSGMLLSR